MILIRIGVTLVAGTSSYVGEITPGQAAELRDWMERRGWKFSGAPYARYRAQGDGVCVTVYNSGKLVAQGRGVADFVSFTLEPEILHTFSFGLEPSGVAASEPVTPHGGIDESGKGDFFGPLVIAGVCVNAVTGAGLRELGVCDSKLIGSSARIRTLAEQIRRQVDGAWSVVTLMPETYNRLYAGFGNLNRLLAWGHARAIENLLEKVPECPRMLSDKFAHESLIRRALLTRGRGVVLEQRVRAESDVAVAAASILARDGFLNGMARLAAEFAMELPRGAGPRVRTAGAAVLAGFGREAFRRCAKLHFKTYAELCGG